jgi:hypothetical protein
MWNVKKLMAMAQTTTTTESLAIKPLLLLVPDVKAALPFGFFWTIFKESLLTKRLDSQGQVFHKTRSTFNHAI